MPIIKLRDRPEFGVLCAMISEWEGSDESTADFAARLLAFVAGHPCINEEMPKVGEVRGKPVTDLPSFN